MTPTADNQLNVRYLLSWIFALLVFGAGFYGLVLYEFSLDDLTKGALISLMTLAAQFVFGEALGSAVGRRSQQAFEAGVRTTPNPETPEAQG